MKMRNKSGGFTLIELLVVIALIAILAAILFPVFARTKEKGRQAACLSNMRQIAQAVMMYTSDHKGRAPICHDTTMSSHDDNGYWWVIIHKYTKNDDVFICPSWKPTPLPTAELLSWERPQPPFDKPYLRAGIRGTYAWNLSLNGAPENKLIGTADDGMGYSPASVIAVAEGFNGTHVYTPTQVAPLDSRALRLRYFHNGGANVAYADGHAGWVKDTEMKRSMWAPYDTRWRP